jgi:hypothetical protein
VIPGISIGMQDGLRLPDVYGYNGCIWPCRASLDIQDIYETMYMGYMGVWNVYGYNGCSWVYGMFSGYGLSVICCVSCMVCCHVRMRYLCNTLYS